MSTTRYIPGTPVIGFFGMFEHDFGTPSRLPMPTVAPTRIGAALLPFACPNCGKAIDFSDRRTRDDYRDRRPGRANHWCPKCGFRFRLDARGVPLTESLAPGAAVAPSRVTGMRALRTNGLSFADRHRAAIDILGADDVEMENEYGEPAEDEVDPAEAIEEAMDFAKSMQPTEEELWEQAQQEGLPMWDSGGGGVPDATVSVTQVPGAASAQAKRAPRFRPELANALRAPVQPDLALPTRGPLTRGAVKAFKADKGNRVRVNGVDAVPLRVDDEVTDRTGAFYGTGYIVAIDANNAIVAHEGGRSTVPLANLVFVRRRQPVQEGGVFSWLSSLFGGK